MKRIYLIAFIALVITQVNAQHVENHLAKIDFLAPGFTYEKGLTDKTTFMINPAIGGAIGYGGGQTIWSINPHVVLEYRYYYNFDRRTRLGKNTLNNTANYLAPRVSIIFPVINQYENGAGAYAIVAGGVYGIQRTYNNGIYIKGEIGIGVYGNDLEFTPVADFKFGYVLNRNKKE